MARLGWIVVVALVAGLVVGEGEDHTNAVAVVFDVAGSGSLPSNDAVAKSFAFQIEAEMGAAGGDTSAECYGLGDLHGDHCDCISGNLPTVLTSCKTGPDAADAMIMDQTASAMCGSEGELHGTHCDCNLQLGYQELEIPTCIFDGTVAWEDITVSLVDGQDRQMNVTFEVLESRAANVQESIEHGFESGEMNDWMLADVSMVSMTVSEEGLEEEETCDQNCLNWKIGFLFLIFAETIVGGALPFLLARFDGKKVQNVTDFMLFFSGGILLSTSLIHILPHALEELGPIEVEQWMEYPYALTMFMVGFLVDYGVDQLGDHILIRAERKRDAKLDSLAAEHKLEALDEETNGYAPATNGTANGTADEEVDTETGGKLIEESDEGLTKEEEEHKEKIKMKFTIAAITVYIGLSVHSVFAGIALGIGDFNTALAMYIAIAAHKIFAAFAAASNLLKSGCPMWLYWITILLFSCVTPLGIAIGIGVSDVAPPVVNGTLQALSAGMLLYVGTIHTLGDISEDSSIGPLLGYIAYVVGVSIMVAVTAIIQFTGVHEAGHGGDHDHGHDH